MKRLKISFIDTDEIVILEEYCLITAWRSSNMKDGIVESFILEFDEELPNLLREKPLMFYVYDEISILKLYRSVYIKKMDWIV